jgi:predicted outer membrane lipoprotein
VTTPDHGPGLETLTEGELMARAFAVLAAVAEERTDDVDQLLVTLRWPDLTTVVYALGNLAVDVIAELRGLDCEVPGDRAAVAEQARRLVVRGMTDGDG